MKIAYIGNFEPPHSTENDIRSALENLGHEVIPAFQEQRLQWQGLAGRQGVAEYCDLLLWTRTPGLDSAPHDIQRAALREVRDHIPVVGYHLDLFWGLKIRNDREQWVREHPYFQDTDVIFSTDGGHEQEWKDAGVDHVWTPPAIAQRHTETVGVVNSQFKAQIAFVGSWRDYHPEWTHRKHVVTMTLNRYRQRFRAWEGHIRGQDLADLYTTIPILIGDSCMLGTRYWSDRVPETLGRGGFLLHPDQEGLRDQFPVGTLVTWPLGDFTELFSLIDYYLQHSEEREAIAEAGRLHVLAYHTYELRMARMMEELRDRGLL